VFPEPLRGEQHLGVSVAGVAPGLADPLATDDLEPLVVQCVPARRPSVQQALAVQHLYTAVRFDDRDRDAGAFVGRRDREPAAVGRVAGEEQRFSAWHVDRLNVSVEIDCEAGAVWSARAEGEALAMSVPDKVADFPVPVIRRQQLRVDSGVEVAHPQLLLVACGLQGVGDDVARGRCPVDDEDGRRVIVEHEECERQQRNRDHADDTSASRECQGHAGGSSEATHDTRAVAGLVPVADGLPARQLEPREDLRHVVLRGGERDLQALCNLAVREIVGDQRCNLALTLGQGILCAVGGHRRIISHHRWGRIGPFVTGCTTRRTCDVCPRGGAGPRDRRDDRGVVARSGVANPCRSLARPPAARRWRWLLERAVSSVVTTLPPGGVGPRPPGEAGGPPSGPLPGTW
jgi:hypothetical protein